MLLKREVFERSGMFTEDYFMYAEDIDLNFKVRQVGFTNYYVSAASLVHHGGGSSRQEANHWATVMKYRAMGKLFQRTKGTVHGFLYRVSVGCAAAGRLLLLALAYPVANLVWNRESFKIAARKWRIILKWSIGWPTLAI
jgi:GT2 family glycosyltransferase